MSALDEAICYHGIPQSRCEQCGEVCPHCGGPWTIESHGDDRQYLRCERLEQEQAEQGWARERQHGEAIHALRMAFYTLAQSHLYDNGRPPAPFSLAIVGYAPTREQATLAYEGATMEDSRWTVRFDPSQRAVFREIDPDVAAKLPYRVLYTDSAKPPDAPHQELPAYLLPGSMRAHHLVRAYAKERPDVGIWVVIEAEHADSVSTLRGWVLDWHEPPPPPPGGDLRFQVGGGGSTATAPEGIGAWADLWPTTKRKLDADYYRFPASLPQQTAPEIKAVSIGIADGPTGRRWRPGEGELALIHAVGEDAKLQTKLVGLPLLNWIGMPNTIESLYGELRQMGLDAVLLLHNCIGAVLEQTNHAYVTTAIDEFIKAIGWDPRSTAERLRMRRQIWRWLAVFTAIEVYGQRPGRYRDPMTKQMLDLTSRDPLLVLAGRRMPEQLALDDSQPPIDVTIGAGAWLDRFRGNEHVLWYFGDVRKLAAIPGGKPAGAWARAIGLALQQRWREGAKRADVRRVGEQNKLTTFTGVFTRRELLDLFPPAPTLQDVLDSPNPSRARTYWKEAITDLGPKGVGVIGFYKELEPLTAGRKGWTEEWARQPLDIRPPADGEQTVAIAEIASRAKAARKARTQRPVVNAPQR